MMQGKQVVAFLKKSAAKNFCSGAAGRFQLRGLKSKSFLLLFFKKDVLAFLGAST
jgi:hypothetical protein